MDRRQLLFGMTALAFAKTSAGLLSPNRQAAGTTETPVSAQNPELSDRERAGLRGPVKTVTADQTNTEYDLDGHILRWQFKREDGSEYGDDYTYDASGHLLKLSHKGYNDSSAMRSTPTTPTGSSSPLPGAPAITQDLTTNSVPCDGRFAPYLQARPARVLPRAWRLISGYSIA